MCKGLFIFYGDFKMKQFGDDYMNICLWDLNIYMLIIITLVESKDLQKYEFWFLLLSHLSYLT